MAEDDKMEDLFGSDEDAEDEVKGKSSARDPQRELEDEDAQGLEDDVGPDAASGKGKPAAAAGASLFGSDDEEDNEDDAGAAKRAAGGAKGGPAQQQRARSANDSDDGEDEERGSRNRRQPVAVGPPLDVACTLVPVPAPGTLLLLRTTNIMSIQPRAFDPATFEPEQEASSAVVRWRSRRLPDGREVRESNARLVRWEDGSVQLLLGEEVLDMAQQDMRANAQYLFKQTDGLLQGQGALTTKVALRPASLDSGLHKRLRETVDRKHGSKKNKVEVATGLVNPELENKRKEALVDEKNRSRTQLARRQDKSLRAYGGSAKGSRPSRLSNQYLEEEQEWEAGQGGGGGGAYEYFDDELTADQRARLSLQQRNRTLLDDRAEADMGRRLQAAKRGGPPTRSSKRAGSDDEEEDDDEDDEEFGEGDEEDEPEYESSGEEEEEGDERGGGGEPPAKKAKAAPEAKAAEPKAAAKPRRRGVVLSDDDEDD